MPEARPDPTRDVLVLVFTRGVSLVEWRETGLLEREWALYDRLRASYARIVVVTHGGREDRAIGLGDGVEVVANEEGLGEDAYAASVVERVGGLIPAGVSVVVKTNQMNGGVLAVRVARALRAQGRRVGLVARGGYLWSRFAARERGADSAEAMRAEREERALCEEADVVVGTSREMLDDLAWRYRLEASRLALIPNYVLDDAPQEASAERERSSVLYAGRLSATKRVDLLIEACALLGGVVDPPITLRIVGEGPEEGRLKARAEELGVEAVFEPRLPHRAVLERMSRCAIYAQASAFEGHPKTVIEAMACGAPVVVCDTPGLGEVVLHAVNGLRSPSSAEALARMLEGLLGDPEWRESLGTRAAAEARETYGLTKIVGLELEAHSAALSRERPGPREPEVRWEAPMLDAGPSAAAGAFERGIRGLVRRLDAAEAARFLMELDARLYELHGEAACAANGGLHPKHLLTRYHDFFVERIARGERVADLGSGVGALACSIASRSGASVVGMDLSEKNLGLARARAREAGLGDRAMFAKGDITRDRLDGAFDVVVLSNVLEHLKERPGLLRMWREWYGAKRFLIRVPAFDREWRVPFKKGLGVEWRLDPTHETEYSLEALEGEMREAGLRLTHATARWGEYWVEGR